MAPDTTTVVILAENDTRRRDLVAAVAACQDAELLLPAAAPMAHAVLLAAGASPLDDIQHAGRMRREGQARHVILTGPPPSPEVLLAAMREGVTEYLSEPLHSGELAAALKRARELAVLPPAQAQPHAPAQPTAQAQGGRIVLVLGAKGGIGTTTVAVNLADSLHRLGGTAALLDLAQPQGETTIFLDLEHAYTWADVAANVNRLDATYLESVMARHASGLTVLPAPSFSTGPALDPAVLRQILTLMRGLYAHVVIDAGTGHDEAALEALEQADEVVLVLDLSLPCLARAKRFLEAVRATRPKLAEKIRLLANRKTSESDIGAGEAENILMTRLTWSVLNDYKTALAAINQGKSLADTDPRSDIARGIAAVARDMARHAGAAAGEDRQGGSLWARLRNFPLGPLGQARRQA